VTRSLYLDPAPAEALDRLWGHDERLADAVEEALDWIEADPVDPRATRRRFSNGIWVIAVHAAGQDWTILWEEPEKDHPVVRHLAETTSI